MNPSLAPRARGCVVCKSVSALEDVAFRLWSEDGTRLPYRPAIDYCRSIGMSGTDKQILRRLIAHRKHIEKWMQRGPSPYAPALVEEGVIVVAPPPTGPARWLDVQQQGMDIGSEAARLLAERLEMMDNRDLIAVAKLGQTAAAKRADMEARGKHLAQVDSLLRLVAGGGEKEGSDG